MTLHDALCYFDHSQANIARALGVTQMTLCRWKRMKSIPYQYQCQLQVMSNGALKASKKD